MLLSADVDASSPGFTAARDIRLVSTVTFFFPAREAMR